MIAHLFYNGSFMTDNRYFVLYSPFRISTGKFVSSEVT